jgi:hypothetical protein
MHIKDRYGYVRYDHHLQQGGVEGLLSALGLAELKEALRLEALLPVGGLRKSDTGSQQYTYPPEEEDEDPPYFFRLVRGESRWDWYVYKTESLECVYSGSELLGFAALVRANLALMDAGHPPEAVALRRQWDRYNLGVDPPPTCVECGGRVGRDRYCFAWPTCEGCLP